MDVCKQCGRAGVMVCTGCKSVRYCSKECQKQHWISGHKGQCKILAQQLAQKALLTSPSALPQSIPKIPQNGHSKKQEVIEQKDIVPPNKPEKYLFALDRVQNLLDFQTPTGVGVGLLNVGNTCFVNAVLQCLTYTPPLLTYFKTDEHSSACKLMKEDDGWCCMCILQHQVQSSLLARKAFLPRNFLLSLKYIGQFELLQQEDAHDFVNSLLQACHKCLIKPIAEKLPKEVEETSMIYSIFGGLYMSTVHCLSCKHVSNTFDSFLDLNLELSNAMSVEEAVLNFTSIESLGKDVGYRCGGCNQVAAVQKQIRIYRGPHILCVQLKRFDAMLGGGKINKPVVFHDELLIDTVEGNEKQLYRLYGVVVHYGPTMFSGHYVAFIHIGNTWYLFDDDKVCAVNPAVVFKQNAYMLFYKREKRGSIKSSPSPSPSPAKTDAENELKKSTDGDELHISSSSVASGATQDAEHRAFYTETEDGNIHTIIIKIDLPLLLSPERADLSVSGSGVIDLNAPPLYHLKTAVGMQVDLSNVHAVFFPDKAVLYLTLPVKFTDDEPSPPTKISINTATQNQAPPTYNIENEIMLQDDKPAPPSAPEPVPSPSAQAPSIPKHSNVENMGYSKLYKEIAATNKNQKQAAVAASNAATAQKQEKVGRNDKCLCGSGKKYKNCHGKV